MLKPIAHLSWADRFGILENLTIPVTDEDICRVFQVNTQELTVARELRSDGVLRTNPRINHAFYELFFKGETPEFPAATQRVRVLPTPPDMEERRLYASQNKVERPKGRKSNNIDMAFRAIPTVATDVEAFANKNRVSIAVLRQHKRFDKYPGTVFVRKNKQTGVTEIWREMPDPADKTEELTND